MYCITITITPYYCTVADSGLAPGTTRAITAHVLITVLSYSTEQFGLRERSKSRPAVIIIVIITDPKVTALEAMIHQEYGCQWTWTWTWDPAVLHAMPLPPNVCCIDCLIPSHLHTDDRLPPSFCFVLSGSSALDLSLQL